MDNLMHSQGHPLAIHSISQSPVQYTGAAVMPHQYMTIFAGGQKHLLSLNAVFAYM